MRKTIRIITVTAVLAAAAALRTVVCCADDPEFMGITRSIPVKHEIKGDKYRGSHQSMFVLTAESWDSPMPDGSDGMRKTVKVNGSEAPDFGKIHFCEPGAYYYTVERAGDDIGGLELDTETYRIMFAMLSDGTSEMVIWDESGSKTDKIVYTDYYVNPYTGLPRAEEPPATDDDVVVEIVIRFSSVLLTSAFALWQALRLRWRIRNERR
jgi:hypothetical protein